MRIFFCIFFLSLEAIALSQQEKTQVADLSDPCCIITQISRNGRKITVKSDKDIQYNLKMKSKIPKQVKKGDKIDFDYSDISRKARKKKKQTTIFFDNQTIISTSTVRRKSPDSLKIR